MQLQLPKRQIRFTQLQGLNQCVNPYPEHDKNKLFQSQSSGLTSSNWNQVVQLGTNVLILMISDFIFEIQYSYSTLHCGTYSNIWKQSLMVYMGLT